MAWIANITLRGSQGLQPGADWADAGLIVPFYGNPMYSWAIDPHVTDWSAHTFITGVDGASLPITEDYSNKDWYDGWGSRALPLFSHNYLEPPISGTYANGTSVPSPLTGDLHNNWWARDRVEFPHSASAHVNLPAGVGYDGVVDLSADSGECLYIIEYWADNSGSLAFQNMADGTGAGVGTLGSHDAADFTYTYIMSCKPGLTFYYFNKQGDNSFDGLGLRLSKIKDGGVGWGAGFGSPNWVVGHIQMSGG